MFIRIETSSGMPIARQIADQIRTHCAGGTLRPGDRLPSVRQLAKQLAVNQNTVLRVYERLTTEGLLDRKQGDGTFVADRLPPGRLKMQRDLLLADAMRLVRRASNIEIGAADLHKLIDESFQRLAGEAKGGVKGADDE
jgi:GntR family transcriptional regulator